MKTKRFVVLDLLKGIAIIMIIIVHNRHFTLYHTNGLRQLINFGQMGCQIFFLASGVSLCYSWEHSPHYARFIGKRYLRLAPGFYLILLVNYVLNVILIDLLGGSPGVIMDRAPLGILLNLLMLHGLSPTYINSVFPGGWYIGTAFLLYLLFPLLFRLYAIVYRHIPHGILLIPAGFFLVGFGILYLLSHTGISGFDATNNSFLYFSFVNQLPCFCLGITLYYQAQKCDDGLRPPLWCLLFCAFLTGMFSIFLFLNPLLTYRFFILPTLVGLAAYFFAAALLKLEKKGISFQKCRFLIACGRGSYGMYLMHGFFCWYGIKMLTSHLTAKGKLYPDMLLYVILLPLTVTCVYITGSWLNRLLDAINQRLTALFIRR